MLSKKKDFIGKAAAARPGLMDRSREQLVGMRPIGAARELTAGAFLFNDGAEATRENAQGYTTSVGWSPTLDSFLALGFVKNGRARHGETMQLRDHLRDLSVRVEITDPIVLDPDGGRMRG